MSRFCVESRSYIIDPNGDIASGVYSARLESDCGAVRLHRVIPKHVRIDSQLPPTTARRRDTVNDLVFLAGFESTLHSSYTVLSRHLL